MNGTDHPRDDLAVYALDALDEDEARAVEAHLETCPACRAELDEQRATLAALSADEAPPPAVWAGIARAIGAADTPSPLPVVPPVPGPRPPLSPVPDATAAGEGGNDGAPADRPGAGPPPPLHVRPGGRGRRGGRRRRVVAIGAAAAAAVVAAGAVALLRPGEPSGDLGDVADAALDAPGARVGTLKTEPGDRVARLVVDGTTGYLIIDDLSVLPAGREYQLWKLGGAAPISLGMVGDGTAAVAAVGVPADTSQLALSTEPAGGSVAPTGDIVATGALPA